MFMIEKNIPLPPHDGRGGGVPKYPFAQMEVGDSFSVSPDEISQAKTGSNAFRRTANINGKKQGRKYTVRKQPDGSFRCWRIA